MSQVKSFKLTTGEELIANLIETTGRGYKIKNPLVVHMMRNETGVNLGFGRWSMIHREDAVVELLITGLAADPIDVLDEVEASYLTNVSGILVPPSPPPGRILQG